jgi:hypothetical protein
MPEASETERRSHPRFPITLPIRYIPLGISPTSRNRSGVGTTVNISSGGVLFEADDTLPIRGRIKILMDWPVRLNDVRPLRLVMWGFVVRSRGKFVAASILRHEFRTGPVAPDDR